MKPIRGPLSIRVKVFRGNRPRLDGGIEPEIIEIELEEVLPGDVILDIIYNPN